MSDLFCLSFRDVSSSSAGVTAGEVYRLSGVDGALDWSSALIGGGDWVPWDQVADLFRGKRVCFLIHGFNVPLPNGVRSLGPAAEAYENLGALALTMTGADLVVPVLWPGDGFIAWSYFTAYDHAKTTGARFADFLTSRAFTASCVSFLSHSLGARVVLETVTQTLANSAPRAVFDTAILTAAAVDDDALDDSAFLAVSGASGLKRIVVLSSMTDNVLKIFFTVGDAVEGALWSNYDADARALGRYGPKFTDSSPARPKTEWYAVQGQQDHGDYLPVGGPPPNQGWTDKPKAVGYFCRDVINQTPFVELQAPKWAVDGTPTFRSGWTPKL